MPELKMVSPLLDHMTVEKEFAGHNGRSSYILRNADGERFVLKRLSVPAAESQVRAMILTGAYPDEAAVHDYYGRVVADIKAELETGKALAAAGHFAGSVGYQVETKEDGVGYLVYILYPLYIPLNELLSQSAITNLRAVNLGIDICDALAACRDAGYLFANVKPENIFLMRNGSFLLGDLGLASLEDLRYSCVPEEYIGPYSAPEITDITATPNTTIDLYSLGMVLYRIYNGNHGPFEDEDTGGSMADKLRMTGKPLPTPLYADYELASIILRACAFRQEDRFATPEDFRQSLTLYMQRNEVSDTLIVPPIVSAPVVFDKHEDEADTEPMRVANPETLDKDFRKSFSPDLSGVGTAEDSPKPAAPQKPPVVVAKPAVEPEQPIETAEAAPPEPALADESSALDAPQAHAAPAEAAPETATALDPDEEKDPNQMELEELLASVTRVVGPLREEDGALDILNEPAPEKEDEPVPTSEDTRSHRYVDAASDNEEPVEEKKRRVSKPVLITILVSLALLIGALVYFLVTWYFVDVTQLDMVSSTPTELVVELTSKDSPSSFVLTCTDSYGSTFTAVRDGYRYTFSGLSAHTTYTVQVAAAKFHHLNDAGAYTNRTYTTAEFTEITEFTASRGNTDGEVLLSFEYTGPAPEEWILSYTNTDGSDAKTFRFDGSGYLVTGLALNEIYTFTLGTNEEAENPVYLSGTTTAQYEILPIVTARGLTLTGIVNDAVTITWQVGENIPTEWTVSCDADGETIATETTTETTYTFSIADFTRSYTFSVSARGMDKPETLVLPANPIIVDNLRATPNEDGSMAVTWETPAGSPDGGWYISYNPVGSLHEPYMPVSSDSVIHGNTATLTGLIPNTQYEIALSTTAADAASQVFGTVVVTASTAVAENFSGYNTTPTPPYNSAAGSSRISLWPEPEESNWVWSDLENLRTTFGVDESIAFCIEVEGVNASADIVTLSYAVRNAEGRVVNDVSTEMTWNNVWFERRHANVIPLPAADGQDSIPGEYTLEVYVNGRLLASIGFTIA